MRTILLMLLFSLSAKAGFVEFSAMGTLRENTISNENSSETRSLTGSIAYYFFENSAIEVSYTEGFVETNGLAPIGAGNNVAYNQVVNFEMLGADFILSMGDRKSAFRPYIKAGGAIQSKEIEFKTEGSGTFKDESDGTYITYGAGLKLRLSKNWSIKLGYDSWTGPIDKDDDEDKTTDSSFRGGISFIF